MDVKITLTPGNTLEIKPALREGSIKLVYEPPEGDPYAIIDCGNGPLVITFMHLIEAQGEENSA